MRITSVLLTLTMSATLLPLPVLAQAPPVGASLPQAGQPYPQPAPQAYPQQYPQPAPQAYPQQQYPQQQYPQQQYPQQQYPQQQYPQQQYVPPSLPPQSIPAYPGQPPMVELRSNDPAATLFMVTGGGTQMVWGRRHRYLSHYNVWSPVCRTPCGVPFDPSGLYQIRGFRMNASSPFVLPQTPIVSLDVDAGHSGPRAGGVILTTFGGIGTVLGIVFAGVGAGVARSNSPSGQSGTNGFLIAGGAMLGLGGAMLAGGITLLVMSRTTVRISGGSRLAQAPSSPRIALSPAGLHF